MDYMPSTKTQEDASDWGGNKILTWQSRVEKRRPHHGKSAAPSVADT
jgi:hypothetical protein